MIVGEAGSPPNDLYLFYGPLSTSSVLGSDDADVVFSGDPDEDDDYKVAMGPEDVDGDGVPDLVVGSHQNELSSGDEVTWAGAVYIISGVGM